MNTRMTSKNHVNIWTYALPTLCLLQFLWALSPKKALGPRESEDRQDDDFGSKTAKKRLRNGWVAATASKTTSIFKTIGVLTRYQTSALKVYWSSSLSARRIWAPDCNISIENLEYQMIRSHSTLNTVVLELLRWGYLKVPNIIPWPSHFGHHIAAVFTALEYTRFTNAIYQIYYSSR